MRLIAFIFSAFLTMPAPWASAKTSRTLNYAFNTVWSTTVRLIRVDHHYPIRDKDKDSGYILFTFRGSGAQKECAASLELIPLPKGSEKGARARIRAQLQIAHQPAYVHLTFMDRLEKKLREEQGEPPTLRKRAPKK